MRPFPSARPMVVLARFTGDIFLMISLLGKVKKFYKRGRPKLTWAEGIRGMMGEKGLTEEDWTERSKWRKKIV